MFWEIDAFSAQPAWLVPVIGTFAALAGFGLLAAFGLRYDLAWAGPPAGAPAVARPRTALIVGTACVIVAALGALSQAAPIEARGIALAQAALMAAAAVCDWRKWQLPLPFTLAGIGLGVVGLALARSPLLWGLAAITVLAALAGFGLLAAFGLRYDPAWAGPPAGAPAVARPRTALTVGTACVIVAALGALSQAVPIEARLVALAQAALMAAAAVCDWRKWQLPLPFTLAGIGLGVVGLALACSPLLWGLAVVTVLAALAINALATAGTLQGGDVLATLWIGLALPGIGLLAFALGQVGLSAARVIGRWPRATRAPVGGAWLMAAVALLALPGLPALIEPATVVVPASPRITAQSAPAPRAEWRAAARVAADATAWVAFAERGTERVARASEAAARVRVLAGAPDAPAELVGALSDLAAALETYDLAAIRAASARLSDLRAETTFTKEP